MKIQRWTGKIFWFAKSQNNGVAHTHTYTHTHTQMVDNYVTIPLLPYDLEVRLGELLYHENNTTVTYH